MRGRARHARVRGDRTRAAARTDRGAKPTRRRVDPSASEQQIGVRDAGAARDPPHRRLRTPQAAGAATRVRESVALRMPAPAAPLRARARRSPRRRRCSRTSRAASNAGSSGSDDRGARLASRAAREVRRGEALLRGVEAGRNAAGPRSATRCCAKRCRRCARTAPAQIHVLVADEHAEAVHKARITREGEPIGGLVSLWLDCVDTHPQIEAILRDTRARLAGYLVTESVVLPEYHAPRGDRASARRASRCSRCSRSRSGSPSTTGSRSGTASTRRSRSRSSAPTSTCATSCCARLRPTRRPGAGSSRRASRRRPSPIRCSGTRPEGDPQKMRENLGRMIASVRAFLDIEKVESHPLSEYVLD